MLLACKKLSVMSLYRWNMRCITSKRTAMWVWNPYHISSLTQTSFITNTLERNCFNPDLGERKLHLLRTFFRSKDRQLSRLAKSPNHHDPTKCHTRIRSCLLSRQPNFFSDGKYAESLILGLEFRWICQCCFWGLSEHSFPWKVYCGGYHSGSTSVQFRPRGDQGLSRFWPVSIGK